MVARRQNPQWGSAIDQLLAQGDLVPFAPGIHVLAGSAARPETLALATAVWRPDAVVTGHLAARLQFRPTAEVGVVEALHSGAARLPQPHRTIRARMDPEWIVEMNGVRLTHPAVTALWLAASDGRAAIDDLLRVGGCDLALLNRAMGVFEQRSGARVRRRILANSRQNPWSPLERMAHEQLFEAGITGWVGNHRVSLDGATFVIDVAFPELKIAIELDSMAFHSDRAAFERDRTKGNALSRHGWIVLRVTWQQVNTPGHLVDLVLAVLEQRSGITG